MSGESGMLGIDHVQLAIPPDTEDTCRRFYVDVLGMREIAKPPALAARGGLWVESGGVQLHFGVETEFHPARKAHPAIAVTDLNHWAKRLADAGHTPHWDSGIPDIRRFYVADPLGNRIEFMEHARG